MGGVGGNQLTDAAAGVGVHGLANGRLLVRIVRNGFQQVLLATRAPLGLGLLHAIPDKHRGPLGLRLLLGRSVEFPGG